MAEATAIDWAWAAGLFEGEGCITLDQSRRWKRTGTVRTLALGMCDEDVVRRFHSVVGAGTVRKRVPTNPRHSPTWIWTSHTWADIERILTQFLPYLGQRRRARAGEMLAAPAKTHWNSRKTHCKRGHPLSGDNLIGTAGKRHCRACKRANDRYHERLRREERKAAVA